MKDQREDWLTWGPHLLAEAESFGEDIIAWRREFHQFPELAYEENVTASRVVQVLSSIEGIRVTQGFGVPTAVVGVLGEGLPGGATMLRADMDALALEEETGLPFSSCIPGIMHACGHDAHMASLLGAAELLASRADLLRHPVVFVFQPAEEGKGGARALTEAGIIRKFGIERVIGLHFWPQLPYGTLFSRPGPITALSDRFHVEIQGMACHAASPHLGVDPIAVAAHVLLAFQHLTSREVDPLDSVVISVGQIEAGDAYNVIPERAHLWGTLRTFDSALRDRMQKRLEAAVVDVCRAFLSTAGVEYVRNYPPVSNDAELTRQVLELSRHFFGVEETHVLERPLLAGEDFSFYSLECPSNFMLLGTGAEYGLHHPKYDVPEELLHLASAWEAFLALTL